MRKPLFFLFALPVFFAALAISQISDADFPALMKSNQASVGAIRGAADNAAAVAPANTLAGNMDKIAAYFKAKNEADAVTAAETARDAAKAIASQTGDKAANLATIQQQCGACHRAHREGAAGNFTIK